MSMRLILGRTHAGTLPPHLGSEWHGRLRRGEDAQRPISGLSLPFKIAWRETGATEVETRRATPTTRAADASGRFPSSSICIHAGFNAGIRAYFLRLADRESPRVAWLDATLPA